MPPMLSLDSRNSFYYHSLLTLARAPQPTPTLGLAYAQPRSPVTRCLPLVMFRVQMNHLLYTIAKCLPLICDAQKCTCFLVEDDKDELWAVQGEVNIRLPKSKGIVGAVATTGKVRTVIPYAVVSALLLYARTERRGGLGFGDGDEESP